MTASRSVQISFADASREKLMTQCWKQTAERTNPCTLKLVDWDPIVYINYPSCSAQQHGQTSSLILFTHDLHGTWHSNIAFYQRNLLSSQLYFNWINKIVARRSVNERHYISHRLATTSIVFFACLFTERFENGVSIADVAVQCFFSLKLISKKKIVAKGNSLLSHL